MSVTRINEFRAADGRAADLFAFLNSLIPYISSSEGCAGCDVLRSKDSPKSFVVIEKWESIESHRKSIEGFPKDDMQAAMALFDAPPKGTYYED